MGTKIQLWKDLPKEIIEVRKTLTPALKKFREDGHYAVLKYDRLYVSR